MAYQNDLLLRVLKGEKVERMNAQLRSGNTSQLVSPRRKITKSPSGTAVNELQELLASPRNKLKKLAVDQIKMDINVDELGSSPNPLPSFQETNES